MSTAKLNYWWKWTINCGIGELLGITAAAMMAFGITYYLGEPETTSDKLLGLFIMLFAGLIEGFILGTLQWKVLKMKFPDISYRKWTNVTILVAMIGWFIGTVSSLFLVEVEEISGGALAEPIASMTLIYASFLGLFLGALFGYSQWLVFKQYALHTAKWIWANALGWAVAMTIIFFFATLPDSNTSTLVILGYGIIGGILAGLTVGAITGFFLNQIVKQNNLSHGN